MATTRTWIRDRGDREGPGFSASSRLEESKVPPAEVAPMPWSWHIARIAGIDVYIHATFLILIAWLVMVDFARGDSPIEVIGGILFVLVLFLCVVLHEYGHALTARRFGIHTRDITLLPIGGVARLERIPRIPWQELLVALAGPAVNVVIAAVLLAVFLLSGQSLNLDSAVTFTGAHPLTDLIAINLTLAVFNLLPAFPMDGGRVLRALLAMWLPRVRATQIASLLGQGMAILFGIVGLMGQPFLMFIALFIFLGAAQEYQTTRWESAVEGLTVRSAMLTDFRTLKTTDSLSYAVSLLLQSSQHDFPVLDEKQELAGFLLRQDLIAALSKDGGASMPVSSAMRKAKAIAYLDEALEEVFERMQASQLPMIPVFERDGRLIGLLTMENVAEVVLVKNALEKANAEHHAKIV